MPELPADARPYRRTPTFTETTCPAALREAHTTKAGVWGRIVVEEGSLRYQLEAGGSWVLGPGDVAIAPPGMPHEVEPLGAVRFHVEFCAVTPAAPA